MPFQSVEADRSDQKRWKESIHLQTRSPTSKIAMVPMMGMMMPSSPDNVQPGSAMYQKSQEKATFGERISGHMMRKPMTVQMTK